MADFVDDINELEGLVEPDPTNWDAYEDASTRRATPPEGKYNLVMPEKVGFKRSQAGSLVVQLDPLVVADGDHKGAKIRFTQVSTKKFKNREASQAGDVLRNLQITARPANNKEWQDVFKQLANRVAHNVDTQWEAYDKKTQQSVIGMENFPKKEDGTYQDFIDIPDGDEPTGHRRIFANLRVKVRGFALVKD